MDPCGRSSRSRPLPIELQERDEVLWRRCEEISSRRKGPFERQPLWVWVVVPAKAAGLEGGAAGWKEGRIKGKCEGVWV
ncbi:hypothetical protein Ddc_16095 [Ditylenchus destructor]|nr:hypothetical protein Ddc_16095 [Ditylenchus destructor]